MQVMHRTSVSAGDGMDFVISDGTLDRHGTRINPKGWDLTNFKRNPIALFGHSGGFPIGTWSNIRVEGNKLVGTLKLAAAGTSARIDELRQLVEQGILRAVSAGFRVIKFGTPGKDDFDFLEQELYEASLVSVGSNANALAAARALNISPETLSLAFGEHATATQRDRPNGEHAARTLPSKATSTMTIAKRIEAAQAAFVTARDAYQAHVAQDDYDLDQAEVLKTEMTQRDARLKSLQDAERALAGTTQQGAGDGKQPGAPSIRKPLSIKERELKPGDLVVRAAVCAILANITQRDPISILEERYRDHDATNIFVRAAVDPAKTTVSGWAAELVQTETVEFLETLRDLAFFPRLAAMGANLQFGPGRAALKIPSRSSTPSISGSFVGEGAAIPVRRIGLTSLTLNPNKMAVISFFTREMAKYSNPQIEALLRQEIRGDTAETIDTLLIDTTAGSATRPAGLLYNLTALSASAQGGWAAIMDDIETLAAPFDAAKAGRNLVLLMNKREARRLALVPGPDGAIGGARKILEEAGITPIGSVIVPAGRLIMLDAADFAAAAGSQPEFEASEHAVLHAEDTSPANIGTAGSPNTVAAPVISMFQTASIALRMILDVTWAMRRAGMVQWIDGADWQYTP